MYESYESPDTVQTYCQNCSLMTYPGYCPCYTSADPLPRYIETPSTPEMEDDSNDSIERRLPSIDIFKQPHEILSNYDHSPSQNETGKRKRG